VEEKQVITISQNVTSLNESTFQKLYMRGENIINIYVINSVEYRKEELNQEQLSYINSFADKQKYNDLRHQLIVKKGDEVKAMIKIYFPDQEMIVEY
jgi:hypothetical protein